jgi:hypothetical protein
VSIASLDCFSQLVNDVARRGLIRIPHAKVNNILPPGSSVFLKGIGDAEYIRGKPLNPMKLFHYPATR